MIEFISQNAGEILQKTGEHFLIAFFSLLLGALFAVPAGILLTRFKKLAGIVMGISAVLQTIPSLALLAFMLPVFGVGKPAAIAALFIYSLLPIMRNTYLGIRDVPEGIVDAAKGMGMTSFQSLFKVEIPLAVPVIMSGIRLSAVYVVAWTTLSSYIGAGGLGDYIFTGLNNYIPEMIIVGTVPISLMAILSDLLLGSLEKSLKPKTLGGDGSEGGSDF